MSAMGFAGAKGSPRITPNSSRRFPKLIPCSLEEHQDRHVYKQCPYFHRSLEIISQVLKKQLSTGCGYSKREIFRGGKNAA